jgi:hypothetical protein
MGIFAVSNNLYSWSSISDVAAAELPELDASNSAFKARLIKLRHNTVLPAQK